MIKTSEEISIHTAGKSALKLGYLPSLNVKSPIRSLLRKVAKFYRHLDDGEHHNTSFQSYIFVSFQQTTLLTKLSNFTDFIAFFPAVLTELSLTGQSQKLKKPRRVFYSQVKRVFQ